MLYFSEFLIGCFFFILSYCRDGLHFTPEGNGVLHQELEKVLNETSVAAAKMPLDFPHHSKIDGKNPEKAFQYLSL